MIFTFRFSRVEIVMRPLRWNTENTIWFRINLPTKRGFMSFSVISLSRLSAARLCQWPQAIHCRSLTYQKAEETKIIYKRISYRRIVFARSADTIFSARFERIYIQQVSIIYSIMATEMMTRWKRRCCTMRQRHPARHREHRIIFTFRRVHVSPHHSVFRLTNVYVY